MPIFRAKSGKLKKLNALPLAKEKNLQQLIEDNLVEVLELRFLQTEYPTHGGRIDTLAVDANGAPVIIEYKRNKNDNVINQALSYLKWLKTQKAGFFEKLMMDKLGAQVAQTIPLNWKEPRVICIAESYSKFDIDTVEVVPLRIELFRYRYYEDDIFVLEPVTVVESSSMELPAESQKTQTELVPTVKALRDKGSEEIRHLFDLFEERVREFDEAVEEKATSFYVAFRLSKNFAEVHVGRNQLKIHLRPMNYNDPKRMVEKIPEGYNWTMDRRIYLKNVQELEYVIGIVEQSYKNVL